MPKTSVSVRTKLEHYVRKYGREVFSTDGEILFCKFCQKPVSAEKKFSVIQHLDGAKHEISGKKKEQASSSSVAQLKPFLEASGKQSQFCLDQ